MTNLSNVSFAYKKANLFDDLRLDLSPGNIYGLLGRNGAGKSTLLKILAGQVSPSSGDITVSNLIPSRRQPAFLGSMYFLPEEFHLPAISGNFYEQLYAPFYPEFDNDRFRRVTMEFTLDMTKKLSQFSYGQKKKFLVAFALATNCKLLLFDEPTNGLDIPSKSQFRRIVASGIGEDQTAIISTHQVRDLETMIDPIVILDNGKIILNESLENIQEKLSFTVEPDADEAAIYCEKTAMGQGIIRKNRRSDGNANDFIDNGAVDLELLFNGIVQNYDAFAKVFGGTK